MINVYTCKNLIPEEYTEMFTDPIGVVRQFMKAKDFTDLEIDTLKEIDEATVYDKEWQLVKTPYGVTNLYNVSKGCQNVLAYIWVMKNKPEKKWWIDIRECGINAVERLFKCAELLGDSQTIFYMPHQNDIWELSKREYKLNGNEVFTDPASIM